MGLLDLPIELFRPIIRDVVLRCGRCKQPKHLNRWNNRDIISLARVNTVFEWEVFLILQEHRFLIDNDSRPSSEFDRHAEYADFIARYVSLRPYPEGACWKDHFPALINDVVDTLIKLKPGTTVDHEKLRAQYISFLCHRSSLRLLSEKRMGEIWQSFRVHLIVAATHLKELSVLAELLCLDINLSETYSEYWGSPIEAAIAIEDTNLVRRFMLHGAKFEHPGWLNDVVHASNAPRLLAVFITEQKAQSVSHTSLRDVADALKHAVKLNKEDVAHMLLDMLRATYDDGHGSLAYYLQKALLEACKRGMKNLLPRLIDAGGYIRNNCWTGGTPLSHLITTTCTANHPATLQRLLAIIAPLKNTITPSDLLLQRAKAGHLSTLGVLLDAGAKLDAVSAMKFLAHVAPWPPNSEAIRCLLERKAIDLQELLGVEEYTGFGVAHCMMVAAQRGNFELLEALARLGVPLDDVDFYAKAGCPLPIVAAEAYGQERTVAALKELVVGTQLGFLL